MPNDKAPQQQSTELEKKNLPMNTRFTAQENLRILERVFLQAR